MTVITLAEMKNYLRVDDTDDDSLITGLIDTSEKLCLDIVRKENISDLSSITEAKTAVMYAVCFLYEHREDADYNGLTLTLRSLLFGSREVKF